MAALAAILAVVAYHMNDWRTFRSELGGPRSDVAVMLTTFTLTVLVDLVVAIEAGMVLAAFLFMRRMAEVTSVAAVTREFTGEEAAAADAPGVLPKGVLVYDINGPFFFGAAEKFKETMGAISDAPRVLILRMTNVLTIDSTALGALRDVVRRSQRDGTLVLIVGLHAQPLITLGRSNLLDEIGDDKMLGTTTEAIARARAHLGLAPADGPS